MFHLQSEDVIVDTCIRSSGCPVPHRLRTCFSPDGQVLLLLDVQHDLQATAHAPRTAGQRVLWVCIEGITLSIASVDLSGRGVMEEGLRQLPGLSFPVSSLTRATRPAWIFTAPCFFPKCQLFY